MVPNEIFSKILIYFTRSRKFTLNLYKKLEKQQNIEYNYIKQQ